MELTDVTLRHCYQFLLFVIAIFAVAGYGVYVLAIWNRKELQKKFVWITSLAVADMFIVVNLVVSALTLFNHTWIFGDLACHINAIVSLCCGFVNIASITWIAIDKYYRECNPEKSSKNYGYLVSGVWCLSFCAAVLPALGLGSYDHMEKDTVLCLLDLNKSNGNRAYVVLVSLLWFVYPVVKMISCYGELAKKSNQFHTLSFLIPAIFILGYTPYALYAGLRVTVGLTGIPMWMLLIIHILPKMITAVNPYLYIQSDPELLQACKDVVSSSTKESKKA